MDIVSWAYQAALLLFGGGLALLGGWIERRDQRQVALAAERRTLYWNIFRPFDCRGDWTTSTRKNQANVRLASRCLHRPGIVTTG